MRTLKLTPLQRDLGERIARGESYSQIGAETGRTAGTIKTSAVRLFRRHAIRGRAEWARTWWAIQLSEQAQTDDRCQHCLLRQVHLISIASDDERRNSLIPRSAPGPRLVAPQEDGEELDAVRDQERA